MGFSIRGSIWGIPILIFAYVLFGGPRQRVQDGIQVYVTRDSGFTVLS